MHSKGYGSCRDCLSVCLFVCLCVCLSYTALAVALCTSTLKLRKI